MGVKLRSLAIDCNDPERLAAFWLAVFDWCIVSRDDDGAVQIGPVDQPDVRLSFEFVPGAKNGKNRLHLDLSPSDQATELDRLIGLGATQADIGQGDVPWVVLADPEGNEFCLLRSPAHH
jgi:predicted enzyme related to lactoylglutathione lyase